MSMNQLSTYSWTFDEDVLRYAEAGYSAIGVWRPKLADFGEERGIEFLREQQLAVSNLLWAGGFTGSEGRRFEESIRDAVEAIHLAAALGCECLVVYTGSRAGHTINHARRMTRNALAELCPIAEANDVTLAIEPVHADAGGEWSFLNDLDRALAFLDDLAAPNVKLVFDTYHLGLEPISLKQLEAIGQRVAIVHLADARQRPTGEQNRCLLGEGVVPIAEIVAALSDGGFDGFCDVELHGEDMEVCSYERILSHSRAALSQLIGV
jgi:sugar phosphate isomerase/epimerase